MVWHILQRNHLQLRIIGRKIQKKRGRRRRRTSMLDDIKKGRSYRQAKEDAQDREKVGVSN